MSNPLEERVVDLEIQLAHQTKTVEDLSDMVSRQWDMIDRLTRKMKFLQEAVVELEDNAGPPANQKPPHY
ncbi:SlyX family protein [Cohaesibacter sp. CAU 1516]|uniref:SlyX family protein n=1 Tax=Cohaesibacter sp. CAU 1516 TaxID=2576038 RepID=UPI00148571AC|nr:SlyX family protein [Cohaesibacter sp. CAU 1516]